MILTSVVCVYNNKKVFSEQLEKSLNMQNSNIEIIAIDNSDKKFRSAASALNYGANIAKGQILIFAHQDIILKTEEEVSNLSKAIQSNPTGTIIGAAGAIEKKKENVGIYTSGDIINISLMEKEFTSIEVACVDEAFFGMKRETYNSHPFNETICDDWHLYAVETCLYNRMVGGRVYVSPIQLHHYSKGSISIEYMKCLVRLADKYRSEFNYIWSTCYKVPTSYLYIRCLYYLWIWNRKIKTMLNYSLVNTKSTKNKNK